jgi:flavin-dependent dehydrogenase
MVHLDAMGCGEIIRRSARGSTRRGLLILNGDRIVIDRRFDEGGLVISRRTIDPLLRVAAADAGADVRTATAARVVTLDSSGATLEVVEEVGQREWHSAPLLIGADGIGSAVARAAGLVDRDAVGRKFGFSMSLPARASAAPELDGAIAMFVERDGYLGVVREGSERLHCAALISSDARMPTRPLDVITWFAERSTIVARALADGWRDDAADIVATGPLPWRTTARTAPGVALVGDAAGYVEPFTGEGMRWAIESAWLLAEALELGPWNEAVRARYEQAWRESIGAMHRRCALVATIVESPGIVGAVGGLVGMTRRVWPRFSDAALAPFLRKLVPR